MSVEELRDPINHIQWTPIADLNPSGYNPNAVLNPQMRTLEKSILDLGWVAPILISRDNLIVDGHHRWYVMRESKNLQDRYNNRVPCAVLDIDEQQAIITMIRMGRARGTHVAIRLSFLVQRLVNELGMAPEAVRMAIDAPKEEIELLLAGSLLKSRNLKNYKYSKAWLPYETTKEQPEESFERDE